MSILRILAGFCGLILCVVALRNSVDWRDYAVFIPAYILHGTLAMAIGMRIGQDLFAQKVLVSLEKDLADPHHPINRKEDETK